MIYCISIPDFLPPVLNQVRGRHWSREAKLKKGLAELIYYHALAQGVPAARGRRVVGLTLHLGPRNKERDKDAQDKLLLDALKTAGMIVDDSPKWLEGRVAVEYVRSDTKRTEIWLEDVEGN